jgi:hypothetical protein
MIILAGFCLAFDVRKQLVFRSRLAGTVFGSENRDKRFLTLRYRLRIDE